MRKLLTTNLASERNGKFWQTIFIPRKTYALDEKIVPQSQILHIPPINDIASQLNYIQRLRERKINRDSPPPCTQLLLL